MFPSSSTTATFHFPWPMETADYSSSSSSSSSDSEQMDVEIGTYFSPQEEEFPQTEEMNSILEGEWTSTHKEIYTAFEGARILDQSTSHRELLEWSAPIVWRIFLRLGRSCQHATHSPPQNPPAQLTRLLHQSIPFYKDAPTRAIILTHALLYMARTSICFHCTSAPSTNQTVQHQQPQQARKEDEADALRCTLFFGVCVQFAAVWLLDCCPSDLAYWKRYTPLIPSELGATWSRLVLKDWKYSLHISREDWLRYCAKLLQSVPFPLPPAPISSTAAAVEKAVLRSSLTRNGPERTLIFGQC